MVLTRMLFNTCEENPKLRTVKLFYFLTLSALATLLPYLPIFLSQIGIQPTELAIIYSLIFFLTFFKNIIVGFIADRFQLHKAILILSCMLTGPLYATLLAVPPVPDAYIIKTSRAQLPCINSTSNITAQLGDSYIYPIESVETLRCIVTPSVDLNSSSQICDYSCTKGYNSLTNSIINKSQILSYPVIDSNSSLKVLCDISFDCEYSGTPLYRSFTFWLCLTIGLLAALCGSNELMMNDAIALSVLGDDRGMWGWSRLWGSLGYGLAAILVSVLIERLASAEPLKSEDIDYTPAFYIYLVLSLSGGIVAYFHPTSGIIKSSQVLKGMGKLLCDPRVIVFLHIMLTLGFYNGIILTYAYLYLREELKATQINIGLCVLTTVLVEVPIFFVSGIIVNKIGTMFCLYLALLAYAVRFLGLVYINNPWWAILIESTHMFTFALMFTAANMHAGKITSKGYTSTMIGLINGIKFGLGLGLGSLLGGYFASYSRSDDDPSGCKFLFLVSGLSSASFSVLYAVIHEVILRVLCPQTNIPDRGDRDKKDSLVSEPSIHGQKVSEDAPEKIELLVVGEIELLVVGENGELKTVNEPPI